VAKHWFGVSRDNPKGEGHPIMYGKPKEACFFEAFPDGGGYPKGFLEWAIQTMRENSEVEPDPTKILHLCSGSVRLGVTVDIRPEMKPTYVCDCRNVPLPDESFDFILADPPYSETYANNLYGTGKDYPKPGQILKEAARLLRPGGLVGLLHFIVPVTRRPLKIVHVYGITTGNGTAIRAWTLLEKVNVSQVRWRNGT
jgi:SAM-dependent methyltransferase